MDDCIIIGAGPAGLTAAIYLARYHLSIRLFDCGTSRAAWIPCTRNLAGFPDGIEGEEPEGNGSGADQSCLQTLRQDVSRGHGASVQCEDVSS